MQALNRLAFGPRPGDVDQVIAMGVDRWIDLQLHPEKIPDDAMDARLAPFRTLRMSSKEIVEEFPDNQMIKQVMDGKKPMPSDPAQRAVFEVQIARLEGKRKRSGSGWPLPLAAVRTRRLRLRGISNCTRRLATAILRLARRDGGTCCGDRWDASQRGGRVHAVEGMNSPGMSTMNSTMARPRGETLSMAPPAGAKPTSGEDAQAHRREERLYADFKIQGLMDLSPDQRYKKFMAMSVDERMTFAPGLHGGKGQDFLAGMEPKQKETLLAMANPQGVVEEELVQAKLLRAIYSDRQLEQVMTDFWFNHFNVFAGKGPERVLLTNYEQDVIRPHALGKFEDLLLATAKSPAMLFYLDNWMSEGPNSLQGLGIPEHPSPYGRTIRREVRM